MSIFKIDLPGIKEEISPDQFVFLSKLKSTALSNIGDPQFGPAELSDKLGISLAQMTRNLKDISHFSPGRMIRQLRMEYAAILLNETQLSIKEIALQSGFREASNFCRSFKNFYDISPSLLREQNLTRVSNFHFQFKIPMDNDDLVYLQWLSENQPAFKELIITIISNISEKEFNISQLAAILSLSTTQLNARIKELLNTSASQFVKGLRLQYASELLLYGDDNLTGIAIRTGYFDQPHFCREFKKAFHLSPKEYRNNGHLLSRKLFIQPLLS